MGDGRKLTDGTPSIPQPESELPELNENDAAEVIVLDEGENRRTLDDEEVAAGRGGVDGERDTNQEDHSSDEAAEHPEEALRDDAVLVLREHTDETLAVAASPTNPNLLVSGGMDDQGIIWDLELKTSLAKVDGAKESVSTVAFSHDGKYAAFGSENGAISIVFMDGSVAPGTPLEGPGDAVHFLSWHPRGPVLLAGSADNVAYMWNAAKGTFMMAFVGHDDAVTCGTFTADGKQIVTGSLDSCVRVWNPTSGETLVRIQTGIDGLRGTFHNADLLSLAVGKEDSAGAMLIASGCAAGDVFVSHRETGQIVAQLPRHEEGVESVAFAPVSLGLTLLASCGGDGVVRIWDIEKSVERCKFEHGGVAIKVVWHSSKPVIASGYSDGSVALWNVLSGTELMRLTGHESFVSDVCFAKGEQYLASTSGDGTVRLYDVREVLSQL